MRCKNCFSQDEVDSGDDENLDVGAVTQMTRLFWRNDLLIPSISFILADFSLPFDIIEKRPTGPFLLPDAHESLGSNRPPPHLRHHQPPRRGQDHLDGKLLLYGGAIDQGGFHQGPRGRSRGSFRLDEHRTERGISVTSAAMQFEYQGHCINLLTRRATRISAKTPTAR